MELSERERQWFTQILGLAGQQVQSARLEPQTKELHLTLAAPEPPYACPHCGREHHSLHDRREKTARDKAWADHTVMLHVPVLRIRCCRGATPIELSPGGGIKKNSARPKDFAR
jgi:transposase